MSQWNDIEIGSKWQVQNIGVSAPGREPVYFLAPDRFLGDQRASYNQRLLFSLRISDTGGRASIEDIVLQGSGLSISLPIFGQGNELPGMQSQLYQFRLHEHPDYGWNPRLSSSDFISVLSNLTALKIRATYTPRGVGFLDNVKLETARRGASGPPANWIERCNCPEGYVGQFCESCAPGYRHEPANGGPFARCVPCNCNGHADICDAESGRCICQHNTAGENCERCGRGFYGNSLAGTPNDCKPCPCPNGNTHFFFRNYFYSSIFNSFMTIMNETWFESSWFLVNRFINSMHMISSFLKAPTFFFFFFFFF